MRFQSLTQSFGGWARLCGLALLFPLTLQACNQSAPPQADTEPAAVEATEPEAAAEAVEVAQNGETGQLLIRANGEDFVRQGFTSKDGWAIDFEHVYVTLAMVTVSQTDPAYDPEKDLEVNAKEQISIEGPITVDLAAGDETAEPIEVATVKAPAGRYNALAWTMVAAPSGPSQGFPLMLVGTAEKSDQTVDFVVKVNEELSFTCGDFVGDQRKGILATGDLADVEATFHFDHLFGDGDAPADDSINTGALGFEPLASLAQGDQLTVSSAELAEQLTAEQYQLLLEILPSLGHVGEGHCEETQLASR